MAPLHMATKATVRKHMVINSMVTTMVMDMEDMDMDMVMVTATVVMAVMVMDMGILVTVMDINLVAMVN